MKKPYLNWMKLTLASGLLVFQLLVALDAWLSELPNKYVNIAAMLLFAYLTIEYAKVLLSEIRNPAVGWYIEDV